MDNQDFTKPAPTLLDEEQLLQQRRAEVDSQQLPQLEGWQQTLAALAPIGGHLAGDKTTSAESVRQATEMRQAPALQKQKFELNKIDQNLKTNAAQKGVALQKLDSPETKQIQDSMKKAVKSVMPSLSTDFIDSMTGAQLGDLRGKDILQMAMQKARTDAISEASANKTKAGQEKAEEARRDRAIKMNQQFIQQVTVGGRGITQTVGAAIRRLADVENLGQLLHGIKSGQIQADAPMNADLAIATARLISGGQGAVGIEMVRELQQNGVPVTLRTLYNKLTGDTTGVITKPFIDKLQTIHDREEKTQSQILGKFSQGLSHGMTQIWKEYPELKTDAMAAMEVGQTPAHSLNAAHPEDDAAMQWAKANPNDPRAQKILQLNGVK